MPKTTVLSRIFNRKPRLDHPQPDKRLAALNELSDDDFETFEKVVREDENTKVRLGALNRIKDLNVVAQFLDDSTLEHRATEIICSQIDVTHELAKIEKVRAQLLQQVDDGKSLYEIAQQASEPSEIAATIFGASSSTVREEAVALVANQAVLSHCERLSRNRDKSINRMVRERLAEVKRLKTKRDETLARAEQLIESASRASAADSHYASLRDAQERSWDALLGELGNLNDQLSASGVEKLDLHMLQTRFPKRALSVSDAIENPHRFAEILGALKDAVDDRDALETAERDWLDALRVQKAPVDLSNEFFELTNSIRTSLKKDSTKERMSDRFERIRNFTIELPDLKERENWANLWTAQKRAQGHLQSISRFQGHRDFETLDAETQKAWREELAATEQKCREVVNTAISQFDNTVAEIETEIPNLKAKLEEGASQAAINMERHVRNLILRLPANARRRHFDALAPYSAELKDFMTWKSFAIQPKREELCERIETLRDNPIEPEQQFQAIKSLRESWNALGPPSVREDVALQRRYDLAAEAAWKVCEAWFEEQNQMRKQNGEKRNALARELETVLKETNWEEADWKSIQNLLSKRKQQFVAIGPPERKSGKSINKRFYDAYHEMRGHLVDYRKSVAEEKEALIIRAKETFENESIEQPEKINAIKALQKEWRDAGSTFHKDEERLWGEFREICNSVFEVQRLAREERKQSISKNIETANGLVSGLLKEVKKSDGEYSPSSLRDVENQLEELFLPANVKRDLERKLAQVDDIVNDRKQAARQLKTGERLKLLLSKDSELSGFEASDSPIPMEWFDAVQADSVWFESRVASDNADLLNDIVLRAEIAAEIEPSAPEDEERRLQLRVDELASNLKVGAKTKEEVAEQLVKEWVGHAHGEQPLRDRFNTAMNSLIKGLGN